MITILITILERLIPWLYGTNLSDAEYHKEWLIQEANMRRILDAKKIK